MLRCIIQKAALQMKALRCALCVRRISLAVFALGPLCKCSTPGGYCLFWESFWTHFCFWWQSADMHTGVLHGGIADWGLQGWEQLSSPKLSWQPGCCSKAINAKYCTSGRRNSADRGREICRKISEVCIGLPAQQKSDEARYHEKDKPCDKEISRTIISMRHEMIPPLWSAKARFLAICPAWAITFQEWCEKSRVTKIRPRGKMWTVGITYSEEKADGKHENRVQIWGVRKWRQVICLFRGVRARLKGLKIHHKCTSEIGKD